MKGQVSFEYMLLIVAVLAMGTIFAMTTTQVSSIRGQLNETQTLYTNYSARMLEVNMCRVIFRRCANTPDDWTVDISVDVNGDGTLEPFTYYGHFNSSLITSTNPLGTTEEGYPYYYGTLTIPATPSFPSGGKEEPGGGFDLPPSGIPGVGDLIGHGGTGNTPTVVTGVMVDTQPSNPSSYHHVYQPGANTCSTNPLTYGGYETCAP